MKKHFYLVLALFTIIKEIYWFLYIPFSELRTLPILVNIILSIIFTVLYVYYEFILRKLETDIYQIYSVLSVAFLLAAIMSMITAIDLTLRIVMGHEPEILLALLGLEVFAKMLIVLNPNIVILIMSLVIVNIKYKQNKKTNSI